MKTKVLLVFGAWFVFMTAVVHAQITGPRDLAELKQETQPRADRNLPPVGGVLPEDVREAHAGLNSLEPDAWAAAFWIERTLAAAPQR